MARPILRKRGGAFWAQRLGIPYSIRRKKYLKKDEKRLAGNQTVCKGLLVSRKNKKRKTK
jgi:hypothetical protein